MMPVILIAFATICSFIFPKNNPVNEFIQFIGAPDLAMLLSLIFLQSFYDGITTKPKMEDISTSLADSIKQISVMLLIIGGGGAFKQVLVDGGISKYISGLFAQTSISPILAAWLITALLRMCHSDLQRGCCDDCCRTCCGSNGSPIW